MSMPFTLRVGRTASGYCLRVEGHATRRGHPALFELFVVQVLDCCPCSVVVDLTACELLDDQFLSVLFDLDNHYGQAGDRRFAIVVRTGAGHEGPECLGGELELPALEPGAIDLESHLMGWHRLLEQLADPQEGMTEPHREHAVPELACR
ncbi:MAG: hypothetical protein P4L84_37780 [Isosphaeraceae bacterium]|nr:hypothetical protein [Isosphaeraceae bacterium]